VLNQRILTAIGMAVFFIGSLAYLDPYSFSILVAVVVIYAAWEWASLSGFRSYGSKFLYAFFVLGVLVFLGYILGFGKTEPLDLHAAKSLLTWLVSWWAIALLWIQGYPSSAVLWGSRYGRATIGLLVLVPTWMAASILVSLSKGEWLIFVVVLIVAFADIGAYFVGSKFGKHKLAKNVSPNKTWEGFLGAILANLFLILFLGFFLKLSATGWLTLFLAVIATVLASVVGDLLESMVKRHRGVKDSGNILPGHGGILDRIDSLTAALPVFALIFVYNNFQF